MGAYATPQHSVSYQIRYRIAPYPARRVRESRAPYRPRRPERTALYQVLEREFDRYVGVYEERFERKYGPLRAAVRPAVEEYLACGRLLGGFARVRCPSCRGEHLLAFSCRTRNLCPSCQSKRSALLAEKLTEEILLPVPHRHYVFTIPRVLRGLFERERRLLGLLSRAAYEATRRAFALQTGEPQAHPGMVTSIQTFGSYMNFNPHIHALVSDSVWHPSGEHSSLPPPDTPLIEELFRQILLRRLHAAERLSEEFLRNLLSWRHSGFSVHAGERLFPEEPRLERAARYLARPPLAAARVKIVHSELIRIETPPHPRTGKTEALFDPVDFVHAVVSQVPDRGQHLVRYYGVYSCRARKKWRERIGGAEKKSVAGRLRLEWALPREGGAGESSAAPNTRRASWARLLKKIFEVDPLLCPRCQVPLQLVSVITEPKVVDKILAHRRSMPAEERELFQERAPPGETTTSYTWEYQKHS